MDNILQTALADAINSLASFFGTTTEAIMAHAPEFLAKYGWYHTLNTLPLIILGCFAFAFLIYLFIGIITMFDIDRPILIGFIIVFVCIVIGVGAELITCAVAPEIVGAHAIMDLLQNAK